MKFLRNLLAAILGFFIAIFLLLLLISIIGAIASVGKKSTKITDNTFLHLMLDSEIVDRSTDNPMENFDFSSLKVKPKLGLNKILRNIEKAENDEKIAGIYLNTSYINANFGGWAMVEEIRNKLIDFKKSGKPIYAFSDKGFSEKAYYLSTVADSIFMNPESYLELNGLGGSQLFFTKTAKKLGLEPQIIRVGKFKAAVEPFMLNKMSRENREQTMRYINSIWDHVQDNIAESRHISQGKLINIVNSDFIHSANKAIDYKLIDGIKYKDEIIALLRNKSKVKENKNPKLISISKYNKRVLDKKKVKGKIAVIYAQGNIVNENGAFKIGPGLAKTLRKVRGNDKIKAVVLRINSPGGSALISDFIWREVDLMKKEKPIIASMSNVAASGGYYIACAADKIVASKNTITGSIGVFGLLFSGKEFYEKKMHLSLDEVKTNKHANFMGGNPMGFPFTARALNYEERKTAQTYVNKVYETFIDHVAKGRNLSEEKVKKIAEGRVWIGSDALNHGLIDEIGGLERAVELAKEAANLESYRIVEYPLEKDFLKQLIEDFSGNMKEKILEKELGSQYYLYKTVDEILEMQGVQARLPYDIYIK